jgi:hypothetical protein
VRMQAVRAVAGSQSIPSEAPGQTRNAGSRSLSASPSASQVPVSSSSAEPLETEGKLQLRAERVEPPTEVPSDSSPHTLINFMHEQLDCFGPNDLLLGHFVLLGRKERRAGGVNYFSPVKPLKMIAFGLGV